MSEDLFGWADRAKKLEDALDRVEAGADATWKQAVERALACCIASGEPFTTDDIWKDLTRIAPGVSTRDARALGPIMRTAQREGRIEKTGRYVTCRRSSRNMAPVAEWRACE